MKTIYISLPMGGHEETVKERYNKAINELESRYDSVDVTISGPCNMKDFDNIGIKEPRDHDWAWYMGRDIEILLRCNAIYMTKGYLHSPGCRTELAVARERDMQVIYADDAKECL